MTRISLVRLTACAGILAAFSLVAADSPLPSVPSWHVYPYRGGGIGTGFGDPIANIGDVNGDGIDDLALGCPNCRVGQGDTGEVEIFFGGREGLNGVPDQELTLRFSTLWGATVTGIGDINRDGFGDVIVGGWYGGYRLYLGSPAGLVPPANDWGASGATVPPHLSTTVAGVGDVNGDGFPDVVIGGPGYSGSNGTRSGEISLYLGSPQGLDFGSANFIVGESSGLMLGFAVAPAGDVDGDGYADVWVAATRGWEYQGGPGEVRLYRGSPSGLIPRPAQFIQSDTLGDGFATALLGGVDVDGDGRPDLLVGAPARSTYTLWSGAAFVYRGEPWGVDEAPIQVLSIGAAGSEFGRTIVAAGDVNRDGRQDVLVGASYSTVVEWEDGQVLLYAGTSEGFEQSPLWYAYGRQRQAYFGTALCSGDFDGDGKRDVAVGAPGITPEEYPALHMYGDAEVFFGSRPKVKPVAVVEANQTVECTGDLQAAVTLDGSGSFDPDASEAPGIVSYDWFEGEQALGTGEFLTVPLPLGLHVLSLTVTDADGLTDDASFAVWVADTHPPVGRVTWPPDGSCFGPADLPVVIQDDYTDVCDPAPVRSYSPVDRPDYSQHHDWTVTVRVTDAASNFAFQLVHFTIDTIPPVVTIESPLPGSWVSPASGPLPLVFTSSDNDHAGGDVIHETISLQGCTILDGDTYGDRDGLLHDEQIVLGPDTVCRVASLCGTTYLDNPELRINAYDCGGNVGFASIHLAGAIALRPGFCP